MQCFKKMKVAKWDEEHSPAQVERGIIAARSSAYISPLPPARFVLLLLILKILVFKKGKAEMLKLLNTKLCMSKAVERF